MKWQTLAEDERLDWLAEYSSGRLSPAQQQELASAALEDAELFRTLIDLTDLRRLLTNPGLRNEVLDRAGLTQMAPSTTSVGPEPTPKSSWWRVLAAAFPVAGTNNWVLAILPVVIVVVVSGIIFDLRLKQGAADYTRTIENLHQQLRNTQDRLDALVAQPPRTTTKTGDPILWARASAVVVDFDRGGETPRPKGVSFPVLAVRGVPIQLFLSVPDDHAAFSVLIARNTADGKFPIKLPGLERIRPVTILRGGETISFLPVLLPPGTLIAGNTYDLMWKQVGQGQAALTAMIDVR